MLRPTLRRPRANSLPEALRGVNGHKSLVAFTAFLVLLGRIWLVTARYVSAGIVVGTSQKQAKRNLAPGVLASSFRHGQIALAIPHTYGLDAQANTAKWRLFAGAAKGNGGVV